MKRWLAFVLAIVFMFQLTACDLATQGDESTAGGEFGEESDATEMSTEENTEENTQGSPETSTEESKSAPVTGVTEVISAQFDVAWPFSEGYAVVGKQESNRIKYNYVDTEGNLLLSQWVDIARSFSEGLACVGEMVAWNEYRFGYIDTAGELVIPLDINISETYCPCAFYQGYAEIIYYDEENGDLLTNVIDREGNRLFDFRIDYQKLSLRDEYTQTYYKLRSSRASELIAQMPESGYCRNNEWMKAYVEGDVDEVILIGKEAGTVQSYVVDAAGNLLGTIEGNVKKLGKDYYIRSVSNGPVEIYDRQWNLLDDKTYTEIEETEHGLYLATNTSGRYVLLNRYLTPLGEPYHEVKIVPDGYLSNLGETYQWKLCGPDGAEAFVLPKPLTDCFYYEMDCYSEKEYREKVRGIYVGTDKDSRQTTHVFDEEGQLLFSYTGVYKPQIIFLTEDGTWLVEGKDNDVVIDRHGKVVFELPYAECQVYGAGEGRIYLYVGIGDKSFGGSSSKYVLMEMTFVQGTWSCVETGTTGSLNFGLEVPSYRYVRAKNEESVILTEGLYHSGIADLELIDGTVLEKDAKELTLVEDGLYIAVHQAMVDGRGVREARLKYYGEDVSGAYENLDRLSEEYIAFCKDGKWGYLKVERE